MIKVFNECVSCDLPCIDCGRKHVERIICDECEDFLEGWLGVRGVNYKGMDLCYDCFRRELINDFLDTTEKKLNFLRSLPPTAFAEPDWFEEASPDEIIDAVYNEDYDVLAEYCSANYSELG